MLHAHSQNDQSNHIGQHLDQLCRNTLTLQIDLHGVTETKKQCPRALDLPRALLQVGL